jgi:hypothetical protein
MNHQHDSLLFRIPRELRDESYYYYVNEDDGYHHDSASDKLRLANGGSIDLSMQYTCKRVAAKMDGLALEGNTITFRTMLDVPDTTDQISNADLFQYYTCRGRGRILERMLEWSHTLVTPEVMRSLCERYLQSIAVKRMADAQAKGDNSSLEIGSLWDQTDGVHTADYDEYSAQAVNIVHDLVQILSSQPQFWHLTARDYDVELRRIGIQEDEPWVAENEEILAQTLESHDTLYISRAQQQRVLDWQPDYWWIPSRSFPDEVAEFIPADDYCHLSNQDRYTQVNIEPDNYFSAAAVAIQFFESLGTKRCSHLRNVVIQEDEFSKADPATHARGLIPFCVANTKLKIERRLDIWRSTIIRASDRDINLDGANCMVEDIGIWLSETKIVHGLGMPTESFTLTLHGPTPEASQQFWDAIIRAAIWDEGCTINSQMPEYYYANKYFKHWLGEGLVDLVKDVIRGDIPARFEADMEEFWDVKQLMAEQEGDWPDFFEEVFRIRDFDPPEGGWKAAREARFGKRLPRQTPDPVDWIERMDEWDMLTGE